jgi:uncharacterized protein YndB with AHSA1/START domain
VSPIEITKDVAQGTMVLTTVFAASPERVWRLWADPRQLERWWGPDPYPATVLEHDLRPGGRVSYVMTGPEGDRHPGYWDVVEVDPPHRLLFADGFADEGGEPDEDLPTSRSEVVIAAEDDGRTRMTITSTYDTAEALQAVLDMGMEEGIRAAIGQIQALLDEG